MTDFTYLDDSIRAAALTRAHPPEELMQIHDKKNFSFHTHLDYCTKCQTVANKLYRHEQVMNPNNYQFGPEE